MEYFLPFLNVLVCEVWPWLLHIFETVFIFEGKLQFLTGCDEDQERNRLTHDQNCTWKTDNNKTEVAVM